MSPQAAARAAIAFEAALIFLVPLALAVRELVLLRREDRLRAQGIAPPEPAWYRLATARQRHPARPRNQART